MVGVASKGLRLGTAVADAPWALAPLRDLRDGRHPDHLQVHILREPRSASPNRHLNVGRATDQSQVSKSAGSG
jgi:hypothetical protein